MRPARRTRLRAAAALACLAATLAWTSVSAVRYAARTPQERVLVSHSHFGEILVHRVVSRAELVSYRMPLAGVVSAWLHYHSPVGYAAMLAVSAGLAVLLLYAAGALLLPGGAFAAAAAAAWLYRPGTNLDLYPESGYLLLVLLCAGLLVWRARAPSTGRTALLACGLGASLMWRSPLAFFGPVLALYEWAFERRGALKDWRRQLLVLLLVPYLFLLPWIAANWSFQRRLVIFERGAANSNIVTGALGLVQNIEGDLRTLLDPGMDPADTGAVLVWAARQVLAHPLRYASAVALRLRYALLLHAGTALLGFLSLYLFRGRREFRALALLVVYFLLVHCAMTVEERYFWPVWPLLALAACAAPGRWLTKPGPAKEEPESRAAAAALLVLLAVAGALCLGTDWVLASFAWRARSASSGALAELDAALASGESDAWLWGERGRERFARGDVEGAAADFRRAALLEPENPASRLQLARADALLGRPEALMAWTPPAPGGREELELQYDGDVLKSFEHLKAGRRAAARELLLKARRAYGERNVVVRGPHGERENEVLGALRASDAGFVERCRRLLGPAPESLRRALNDALTEIVPESAETWFERAELAAREGRTARLREALARADELAVGRAPRTRLARLYARVGEGKRAEAVLALLSREFVRDAGLALESAQTAAGLGDRAGALAALARAESYEPSSEEDLRRLAGLYRELGEPRLGAAAVGNLLRVRPASAALWVEKSQFAASAGDARGALEALAKADALGPGVGGQLRLIAIETELRRYDQALERLRLLVKRHPGVAGFWLARAEVELRLGRPEAARASAARAEALPLNDEQRRRLVSALRLLREDRRAGELLTEMLARRPSDPDLRLEQAELAAQAGRRKDALAALARAESPRTGGEQGTRRVVELYHELGADERASAFLSRLTESRPGDPAAWLARARHEALLGAREAALSSVAKAEAASGDDADARREAAELFRDLNDIRRTAALTGARGRERAAGTERRLSLARRALDEGRRDEALGALDAAARETVVDPGQRAGIAELYRRLGAFRRGLAFLREQAVKSPRDAEPALDWAEAEAAAGDARAARRALEEASRRSPNDAAKLRQAALLARLGEPDRSARLLDELAARAPLDPRLWLTRAELELDAGRRDAALAAAAKARANAVLREDLLRLAELYGRLGEAGKRRETLDAAAKNGADGVELRLALAAAASARGARGEALSELARAEALLPGEPAADAEAGRRVALAYQDMKEPARAAKLYARLLRSRPGSAPLLSDKALAEYLAGDADAAVSDLRAAIRLDPRFLPASLTLGAIHTARGDAGAAAKVYDAALETTKSSDGDPMREAVRRARAELPR